MQAYEMKIFEIAARANELSLSNPGKALHDFGIFASRFCGDDRLEGRAYLKGDNIKMTMLFAADFDPDVVRDACSAHGRGIYVVTGVRAYRTWDAMCEDDIRARYRWVGDDAAELYRRALKREKKTGMHERGENVEKMAAETDEFTRACCAIAEAVERGADDGVRSAEDLADLAKALKIAVEAEMMRREMDKHEAKAH